MHCQRSVLLVSEIEQKFADLSKGNYHARLVHIILPESGQCTEVQVKSEMLSPALRKVADCGGLFTLLMQGKELAERVSLCLPAIFHELFNLSSQVIECVRIIARITSQDGTGH